MAHILKNENIEIQIDSPDEGYNFSRFDWTGKIVNVKFQGIQLSGKEKNNSENKNKFGQGFCNEFGIDAALGFDETERGERFHKIGVGLLKKEDPHYLFSKAYDINPAEFKTVVEADRITFSCKSEKVNGYAYLLNKEIVLTESGFTINYYLKNTGEKDILTNEYNHNFTAINKSLTGANYVLNFPFALKPDMFDETVNPNQKVEIGQNQIKFEDAIHKEFFFSNLTGGKRVNAEWELKNQKSKIGIKETGSFQTRKVNLWGNEHVIRPELFFEIFIKPGKFAKWSRAYNVFRVV